MKTATLKVTHIGRITTVSQDFAYGFISIATVSKIDDIQHGLATTVDIYIHQNDCSSRPLRVGMLVSFDVTPDLTRAGAFRAIGAVEEIEAELLPEGQQPMEGFNALAPFAGTSTLAQADNGGYIPPTQAQAPKMKASDPATLALVSANNPAPGIPRDHTVPENVDELMVLFLQNQYPSLVSFGAHFGLDSDETEFNEQVSAATEELRGLGMDTQVGILENEAAHFLSFRKALVIMKREKLIRKDAIIPMEFLPDFFAAVPVWFHFGSDEEHRLATNGDQRGALLVPPRIRAFCSIFPNQNWVDMLLMFNRRPRTHQMYAGDQIPLSVLRRVREMLPHFDHVVIMTPYHDVAGRDWQRLSTLRNPDPYIIGVKVGVPYFFILARFSDSGTFPAHHELIADTMKFLDNNKDKLRGFNSTPGLEWLGYDPINPSRTVGDISSMNGMGVGRANSLGDHLIKTAEEALLAFEQGKLFDWLRGAKLEPVTETASAK